MGFRQGEKELKARFDTGRYVLIVRSVLFHEDGVFEVKAIDKSTLLYSFINNTNGFLNEMADSRLVDLDDTVYSESTWNGSTRQVRNWFKRAKELFSDTSYLSYFEKLLDDDRVAGEWGNQVV